MHVLKFKKNQSYDTYVPIKDGVTDEEHTTDIFVFWTSSSTYYHDIVSYHTKSHSKFSIKFATYLSIML